MTIRPPKTLTNLPPQSIRRPSGADILEAEMRGEQAYALGLAAKKMEKALAEYRYICVGFGLVSRVIYGRGALVAFRVKFKPFQLRLIYSIKVIFGCR